jgi:hypothetical protein
MGGVARRAGKNGSSLPSRNALEWKGKGKGKESRVSYSLPASSSSRRSIVAWEIGGGPSANMRAPLKT